mmetsp:Transcript_23555/g.74279  ORF Transcript_23555/g.74279 Transcript_23555/m.74279 type:complete len:211 (+) Transcript_23555:565-1197(+)
MASALAPLRPRTLLRSPSKANRLVCMPSSSPITPRVQRRACSPSRGSPPAVHRLRTSAALRRSHLMLSTTPSTVESPITTMRRPSSRALASQRLSTLQAERRTYCAGRPRYWQKLNGDSSSVYGNGRPRPTAPEAAPNGGLSQKPCASRREPSQSVVFGWLSSWAKGRSLRLLELAMRSAHPERKVTAKPPRSHVVWDRALNVIGSSMLA